MDIKQLEQEILNFIQKVEHKLPEELTNVATIALGITQQAEKLLNSGIALATIELDPALEPYREEILAILAELEIAFKAVIAAFQKGALHVAQSLIAGLIHGNVLAPNRYDLACQTVAQSATGITNFNTCIDEKAINSISSLMLCR